MLPCSVCCVAERDRQLIDLSIPIENRIAPAQQKHFEGRQYGEGRITTTKMLWLHPYPSLAKVISRKHAKVLAWQRIVAGVCCGCAKLPAIETVG
jgi:hypothetical protein